MTLSACEHRVVIRHHHALRAMSFKFVTVHCCNSADETVSGSVLNEIVELATFPLGGQNKRSVLDERALVDQVLNIFTSGAVSTVAPARNRCWSRRVKSFCVSVDDLCEVGAIQP